MKWEKLCEAKEIGGMGFKEIENFNKALLAKQVWHLLNNQDSLCYKVFKARSFPDCSILEAQEAKGGSFAWKSILSAREVVKQGLIWRIGNGANVSIKEDKWLPDPCYRKVSSPLPSIPPEANVSSLIDYNLGTWKKEDIKQFFLPHEADAIISIPLSLRMPTERLVWSKTPSGNFSTQSAYRLLASNASATNPSSSNPIP